jgi:hypothetical protein
VADGWSGYVRINGGIPETCTLVNTLHLWANYSGEPPSDFRLSLDGSSWGDWLPYHQLRAYALTGDAGDKFVYVQYRESPEGSLSEVYNDSVRYTINDEDGGTASQHNLVPSPQLRGDWEYGPQIAAYKPRVDFVFFIESTESMSGSISDVRETLLGILGILDSGRYDYRIAIVAYGDYYGYDTLGFSSDFEGISGAVGALTSDYGGSGEQPLYYAMMSIIQWFSSEWESAAYRWRDGPSRIMVIIGDSAPWDPDLWAGYTITDILNQNITVDAISFYGDSACESAFQSFSEDEGGLFFTQDQKDVAMEAIVNAAFRAR